jgi:hypothetical protein
VITFHRAAAVLAASPAVASPFNPNLIHCILCDHAAILTLFNHFFQASEANVRGGFELPGPRRRATAHGAAARSPPPGLLAQAFHIMSLVAGALALELRLHSHAEMMVLYPITVGRLGAEGAALAQRALAEHAMVEQSIAEILRLRSAPGELVERVKQAQIEVMAHQGEEEAALLPKVAAALSQEELGTLGNVFRSVKQSAALCPQTPHAQAASAAGGGGQGGAAAGGAGAGAAAAGGAGGSGQLQ